MQVRALQTLLQRSNPHLDGIGLVENISYLGWIAGASNIQILIENPCGQGLDYAFYPNLGLLCLKTVDYRSQVYRNINHT